ncbi:hypothetical protein NFI96_010771, partial [Prochilodus magdalenae]
LSLSLLPLPLLRSSNDSVVALAGLISQAQQRGKRWGRVTCVHTVEFSTTRFVLSH